MAPPLYASLELKTLVHQIRDTLLAGNSAESRREHQED
jgi:hypothetical protein